MGRPPAYIFVVRHGNRLDAADKQWHLSSPTPYDPPLTYGGWLQSRALGARIGSILRDKISEDDGADGQDPGLAGKRKRRKYRVVIHSSPFLRCIQTSIAVSAGIAQEPLYPSSPNNDGHTPGSTPSLRQGGSARSRPTLQILQSVLGERQPSKSTTSHTIQKTVLRLDAFLGEWLSPGYFELITPPPESVMMLASAKAELLRREDYGNHPNFTTHIHSSSQGQLWGSPARSSPLSAPVDGAVPRGLENVVGMGSSLPRSSSISSHTGDSRRISTPQPVNTGGYVAPVPNYAISSSATIPLGYVTHAKDACVDVDYQWDSMRGPLEWGDGGTFGEEWTAMHRRFRKGIQHLVDWYSVTDSPTQMVTKPAARFLPKGADEDRDCAVEESDDDDETEAVVILVSHGAGCNALIGAITHQPVLMDVGLASLTVAVRKPGKDDLQAGSVDASTLDSGSQGSKSLVTIHQYYDLKLFANTEHLRSTPSSSRSPSVANMLQGSRGRVSGAFSSSLNNVGYGDGVGSRSSSASAVLTSTRRSTNTTTGRAAWTGSSNASGGITVGSGVTSFTNNHSIRSSGLARTPSIGLWSPIAQRDEEELLDDDDDDDDDDDGMLLNFSHEKITSSPTSLKSPTSASATTVKTEASTVPSSTTSTTAPIAIPSPISKNGTASTSAIGAIVVPAPRLLEEDHDEDVFDNLSETSGSNGGLWSSSPRPPGPAELIRDLSGMKRRWTVNERS